MYVVFAAQQLLYVDRAGTKNGEVLKKNCTHIYYDLLSTASSSSYPTPCVSVVVIGFFSTADHLCKDIPPSDPWLNCMQCLLPVSPMAVPHSGVDI